MKIGVESYYTVVVFSTDEIITGIFCPVLRSMVQRRVTSMTWRLLITLHSKRLKEFNVLSLSLENTKD